jgi:hypothetical protein
MPRSGSGEYSKPPGTTAIPGAVVASATFNGAIDDLVADANAARPISAGGTGAGTKSGAQAALGVVPQSSVLDATAGRLLQVGGFGFGGVSVDVPGNDCNSITETGVYTGVANTTANMPLSGGTFTIVHYRRADDSGHTTQIAYRTAAAATYKRSRNIGGAWSAWAMVEGILSSGTNANGTYTVYDSGRIECRHVLTYTSVISTAHYGVFRSPAQTWTFPVAFTAAPVVFVTSANSTAAGAYCHNPATTTTVTVAATAGTSQASDTRTLNLLAIGA